MEKQTKILVVVAHEGILSTVLRLINKEQSWHATGAQSIAGAKDLLSDDTALVLLGSGLTEQEEQEMIDYTTANQLRWRRVGRYYLPVFR
jgi:hypothetical protein